MKFFTVILSLYILALTAVPCIDVHGIDTSNKSEEFQKTSTDRSSGIDHCSPFCTCDCCVSPVLYQDFNLHFNSFSLDQNHFTQYFTDYVSSIFTSIWQPPKLV